MIIVKGNTKRAEELRYRATNYEGNEIYDVYDRPSYRKVQALRECREMCENEGGERFRICGHCMTNFSVSWRVKNGWRLETYRNSYLILDEEA